MTPWTALLESLHSALIDELTDRHPEPKPTLGMPLRQNKIQLPQKAVSILICEFEFGTAQGFSVLAFEPSFMTSLKITPTELWKSILKRAGSEFLHRKIQPKIRLEREFAHRETFPEELPQPSRTVWIPFQIPAGNCYLALAVL